MERLGIAGNGFFFNGVQGVAGSNPAVPTIKIKQLHESPLGDFFVSGLCDRSGARSVTVCKSLYPVKDGLLWWLHHDKR